jgi:hypothetical protein
VKVKEEGPVCYCCDSEDEQSPPQQESGGGSESANSKPPTANPGWFGKGYRKKIKKKR